MYIYITFYHIFVEFVNSRAEENALEALDHYIKTAEYIRSDEHFEDKIVSKLEKYILDPDSCVRDLSGGVETNHSAQKSFFAIAAPSMDGKTQSAAVFDELNAFYFSLARHDQLIYKNFAPLSCTLETIALHDVETIKNIPGRSSESGVFISAQEIQENFTKISLWTLGFIVYLVKDAQQNYSKSLGPWIKYHSQRGNFNFAPISYAEFVDMEINFQGYCLFLDEFFDSNWSVYIRNLARAIGIRCVVANTNARIGNLVGRRRGSGGSTENVWSFVVTCLGPSTTYILDRLGGLTNSINVIKAKIFGTVDSTVISHFLDNFVDEQIQHLRPGIAIYVADALKKFSENVDRTTVNFKVFLDEVCIYVARQISYRKPCFKRNEESMYGNIGLLLPESYMINSTDIAGETYFNGFQFLEYHLYYLRNPQMSTNWIFITFPPNEDSFDLLFPLPGDDTEPWTIEYTYFNEKEFFGVFGCMFIPFSKSVTSLLINAHIQSNSHSSGVHDTQNPVAPSNPSNPLEVSSAVSIVDATHHSFTDHRVTTFAGQPGTDFLNNLITNLIEDSSFRKWNVDDSRRNIVYPSASVFDLKQYMSMCHFPFLYSLNREVPLLQSYSDLSSSLFVSMYERTMNSEEIDGRFIFKSPGGLISRAVVECKNYSNTISTTLITEILAKFIKNSSASKLSLIFCRSVVDSTTASSAFTNICRANFINVYRIKYDRGLNIVPFSPNFPIFPNPKYISILLEADFINQIL
jgi:hypothetical protein